MASPSQSPKEGAAIDYRQLFYCLLSVAFGVYFVFAAIAGFYSGKQPFLLPQPIFILEVPLVWAFGRAVGEYAGSVMGLMLGVLLLGLGFDGLWTFAETVIAARRVNKSKR